MNKIGIDIVHIPRFSERLQQPGVQKKIFLPSEQHDKTAEQLAGMFAAKEAILKATGKKAGTWLDIEISRQADGAPVARVTDGSPVTISISHDGDYAIAIAFSLLH